MPVRKGTTVTLPTRALTGTLFSALVLAGVLTGCTAGEPRPAPPAPAPAASKAPAQERPDAANRAPSRIPGIGPRTHGRIPDGTTQVLVVTGDGPDGNVATAVLHQRDPAGRWHRTAGPWTGHNALRGWTDAHTAGDLRSPIGVFRIGDAGGRLPDPGARFPYDQDEEFAVSGTGFLGEPLEGSFDYVVAIDYNRIPGTTPLNKERPLGPEAGGGVWIHVDHGGPTQACVSLPREDMTELLRALDPAREPVVVMGPASVLAG
ncbi:L,D-transpeptidase family protein [Streptomyces sp. SKN60]|uniref:L,D-transpeptidase family protein n=1 Tax=Streptomyces sp. SKN60 TaxID=2855506 RepID=UPI002246A517|nr:L,D-transpeptidase family protein [Streptomyces sp. SKN60]MCX2180452.1 L,D-transpeptidase family protein [Streptomyces sp. SKN60]